MAKQIPSKMPKATPSTAKATPPEKIEVPASGADTVSIPRDQVRFNCPKHGDITNATLHLSFADQEGNKQGQFLYCLHCLNEVLLSLQKSKAIEIVQIVVPEEIASQLGTPKAEVQAEAEAEVVDPAAALQALAQQQENS
jgi:hypothetical protein